MNTCIASCRLLFRRIVEDHLLREASALTYQSFLAIVPLFAVLFGIAKGFGLENILENWMQQELSDHQEMLSYLLQFSQTTLQEAKGGVIAGIGVLFLLFTSIRLLSAVEATLTSMWGLTRGRPWLRKVSDYLALLLTCPLLLTISSSVNIFLNAKIVLITAFLPTGSEALVTSILSVVPFATSAMLFSLILYAIPCAPVRPITACLAGSVTAVVFQCIQSWYIFFQLHLTKISAIYGSFVALPLFLVWLWISWLLVLVGGEFLVFLHERGWKSIGFKNSQLDQLELDVCVLTRCLQRYEKFASFPVPELYQDAPVRYVSQSIERLKKRNLIHESWSSGYTATIVPSHKAFSTSLYDVSIPDMSLPSLDTPLAQTIQATLTVWKDQLSSNPTIEQLARPVS